MDERKLEEVLKAAKNEADRFFCKWDTEPFRRKVNMVVRDETEQRCFFASCRGKLGAVLVCLLLFILIPLKLSDPSAAGHQTISLDDRKPACLIDFVPIRGPYGAGQSLLVILWEESPEGRYEIVYSSMFHDSSLPRPVYTLDFPGISNRLALISSEDSQGKYLHYRLIGYSNQAISTILAEDYVPGGKLGIREGRMVAERKDGQVTHIIPYQIDARGEVVLSADQVQLQVGEELLLIGFNLPNPVKFLTREDLMKRVNDRNAEYASETLFRALDTGEDFLELTPDFGPARSKNLLIKVVK